MIRLNNQHVRNGTDPKTKRVNNQILLSNIVKYLNHFFLSIHKVEVKQVRMCPLMAENQEVIEEGNSSELPLSAEDEKN